MVKDRFLKGLLFRQAVEDKNLIGVDAYVLLYYQYFYRQASGFFFS